MRKITKVLDLIDFPLGVTPADEMKNGLFRRLGRMFGGYGGAVFLSQKLDEMQHLYLKVCRQSFELLVNM